MPRSIHGGRHELGQNFLNHLKTINYIVDTVAKTEGSILEIGAGDGAITHALARLGRDVTAIDIDEHRVRRLQRAVPSVHVVQADALKYPLDHATILGNIPFHITTPILRRVLRKGSWNYALLLTQWEVARKRAGVGGGSMMTAQAGPWFEFELKQRVPARFFTPIPSVDGGLLAISRRVSPLLPTRERQRYNSFVWAMFTGRGGNFVRVLQRATRLNVPRAKRALSDAGIKSQSLPRDLTAAQWVRLWKAVNAKSHPV